MALTIKEEYKGAVVGFNKSAKPLGQRNDLILLFDMTAKNKGLLKYFDETPDKDEAEEMRAELFRNSKKRRK